MQSQAATPEEYIESLPDDRKTAIQSIRSAISRNLPEGFSERMGYGMLAYVVPHSIYPPGYHCDPKLSLPFINVASQKNFIAVYHMGLYAKPELLNWFVNEYPKHAKSKLDMGKSCIRLKKMDDIPLNLIAQLARKMSVNDWISTYESNLKR
jgi:uncharacterized protein YdhG (YjbR/CyaY superfamily)